MPDRGRSPRLSLRLAQAADRDFLFELYRDSQATDFALLPLSGAQGDILVRMQFQAREAGYHATFPDAADRIILGSGKPVGRLLVASSELEIRIVDLAVMSTERGAGAGSFAISEVFSEAAVLHKPVQLSVLKSNSRAACLYRRCGFRDTSENQVYVEMEWADFGSRASRPST